MPTARPITGRIAPRPRYLSIAIAGAQEALAYRGSTLLNLSAGMLSAAATYYIWRAVYADRPSLQGFTWAQMQAYVLVAFVLSSLVSFQSMTAMTANVRTGQVAVDILRPLSYLGSQLARTTGRALVESVLGSCLALLLAVVLLDLSPPASASAAIAFIVAAAAGFVTKFLIHYLVSLLCFLTTNATGLIWTELAVVGILSGAIVPLDFFPSWLVEVLRLLPFQGIVYQPVEIYLGRLEGTPMHLAGCLQLGWIAALLLFAKVVWRPALRRLDVQGG